jgi:hypothetical protein
MVMVPPLMICTAIQCELNGVQENTTERHADFMRPHGHLLPGFSISDCRRGMHHSSRISRFRCLPGRSLLVRRAMWAVIATTY